MILQIMLACNDPNTGNHTGQVDQIEVPNYVLQIEGPPVLCAYLEDAFAGRLLRLGDRFYHVHQFAPWCGNWCWDAVTLAAGDVAEILERLWAVGWSVIEAESSLFEKWQAGERITAGDLERLVGEGG